MRPGTATHDGAGAENDWDLWVYPDAPVQPAPADIHVARTLDDAALARLRDGGAVLLNPVSRLVKTDAIIGFSSVFWNTVWTDNQPPHTLGVLCNPAHPAFALFPTEFHSNWQWWELIYGSAAMALDGLPPELRPLVQTIDTWFENRRLGLLFEARVGGGKLMVCSMDLVQGLDHRPVARQFRESLLEYMAGPAFRPRVELTREQIFGLTREPRPIERMGGAVSASSEQAGYEAVHVMDANPVTLWHSSWEKNAPRHPHALTVAFGTVATLHGVTVLPRQDGKVNGFIREYEVYVSNDGETWGEPVARGEFERTPELKTVRFARPMEACAVRLIALSGFAGQTWACIAEFDILTSPE